jgi:hypothetical protein
MRGVTGTSCECVRNTGPQEELNHPRRARTVFGTASYQQPTFRLWRSESAGGSLITNRTASYATFG